VIGTRLLLLGVLLAAVFGDASRMNARAEGFQVQNSCVGACRAQYNQCLISTKGSPSCSAQQEACLRRCLATRRRTNTYMPPHHRFMLRFWARPHFRMLFPPFSGRAWRRW
jgi:hypothetical protein